MAVEYRVWDMSMVFAKFPETVISRSELRKRAAILVDEGLWQEIDSIEEDLRNNKLRVLLPFIRRQVGRKFKSFGPGYQLTNFRDFDAKNNNLKPIPKLHVIMGGTFRAMLDAGVAQGLIKLDGYTPGEIHGPEVLFKDDGQTRSLRVDAFYKVSPLDKSYPTLFRYHEDETGEVHGRRFLKKDTNKKKTVEEIIEPSTHLSPYDLDKTSIMQKVQYYTAIHDTLVKKNDPNTGKPKHPPFLVDVVCLQTRTINKWRRVIWEYWQPDGPNTPFKNKPLNIFRFTTFKKVQWEHPEILLKEPNWYTAMDVNPHTYFE